MKKIVLVLVILLLITSAYSSEKPWRFVSMPDFLNVDTDYPQVGWEDSLSYILQSVKAEDPDFLLVPGDMVMGEWHLDKQRPGVEGIKHYADRYYPAWKNRMSAHGLKWYAAIGDHELGDNSWHYKNALKYVDAYKKQFRKHFQMPLNGPEHMKGTAFWWRHKNVLFVSVDIFEKGKSWQGDIRAGVTGKQLDWLNKVLKENKDASHKIVMGHAPCLGPVRKWSSSALLIENRQESTFWQSMAANNVDLYLCGEVHAITCTQRDGVQQVAHGGLVGYNSRTNYMVVDVYEDRMELTIKEIDMIPSGKKLWQPHNNRPLEKVEITPAMKERGFTPVGKLTINKTAGKKSFDKPQGYFLKKFEKSTETGFPVFRHNYKGLNRINLDGSVEDLSVKTSMILDSSKLKYYVDKFNADDEELFANIPNKDAFAFLKKNIPLFECPDKDFERTYFFRWWTYRKHVKGTPDGYVITEFLPKVPWSGKHNTISCPAGHQFYEGRWLRDSKYLDDYAVFWLRKGGSLRSYSFWIADAYYNRNLVTPNKNLLVDLLDDLINNYKEWEKFRRPDKDFLFWQVDDRDGMEVSIGKSGYRATINSYMYGDAMAISKIAIMAGRDDIAKEYTDKAEEIKKLVLNNLWDDKAKFFKVMSRKDRTLADVREQHGLTPWYFNLPEKNKGYEQAWAQLMDPKGFYAPYGPTTAEQRHPRFQISYKGHECQWNGPSWPLSTSVTLTGMANVLNNYPQDVISKEDYYETLKIYTKCHQLVREDGRVVSWIDENINPFTGDWISRTRLKSWRNGTWDKGKGGKERGKDYNHSTYNDLVITGLVGLRPRADNVIEVNPLLPEGTWDYFCLDNVLYHGHNLTIVWDKSGRRYKKAKGLSLFVDGKLVANSEKLTKLLVELK